jgi:hypothetical protein
MNQAHFLLIVVFKNDSMAGAGKGGCFGAKNPLKFWIEWYIEIFP